jgi:hypothetical protein
MLYCSYGSVHLMINLYLEDVLSLFMNKRNRTSSEHIAYGPYFYFSRLSLRKTSERLPSCFLEKSYINQSGIGYRKSINPKIYLKGKRKKIEEFIIDETLIKIGSELIGFGLLLLLNLRVRKSLELVSISKEKEICS